jgi:DNA polymerase-3 subunit beta
VELKCARFQGRINGIDAEEFPPIPTIGVGVVAKISPQALRLAITQVAFAAASDDTRPVLTGVHSEFEDAKLTLLPPTASGLPCIRPSGIIEGAGDVIIPAKAIVAVSPQ